MKVLFVDCVAARGYTCHTLRSYAMGGSEATVLRVARGLAALPGFEVALFQLVDAARSESIIDGIRHVGEGADLNPDVVVHLRTAQFAEAFREQYPKARQVIWLHDNFGAEQCLEEPFQGEEVVCVSDWHTRTFAEAQGGSAKKVSRIYNPVVIPAGVTRQEKVKGLLGFFSSPHKGLSQVLSRFQDARKLRPDLTLAVGNPGYVVTKETNFGENVTFLGELPHHRVLEEMSRCEVLFYPQTVFPETFGLVMAEAQAMGTPALAHDFGATYEIIGGIGIGHVNGVVDCSKPGEVLETLRHMLEIPLAAGADPRFALDKIIGEWRTLLEGEQ